MTDLPVPLPSAAVPAGAPAWLSHDASRWAEVRPPEWAHARWSALVLVVSVLAATGLEPDPGCTVAAPCGPDWVGMVQMGLAVGLLYWYVRLPEVVLVCAPVLAVIVAVEEFPIPDAASDAANAAVIAALAFGWAAAWQRLAARRRQQHLAEQAGGGVRCAVPGGVGPLRRGTIPIAVGLLLCAVAAGAVGMGLWGVHQDEQRAGGAESISAVVVARGEETLRVRTPDGTKLAVDAQYPEDHATGSKVTVLRDGHWMRLAAEPYDAFGWQAAALAAGLPGLSFLTVGALARRRAARLRGAPVPVLRALIRLDQNADSWVYAADDTFGSRPLFRCTTYPVFEDGEDEGDGDDEEDPAGFDPVEDVADEDRPELDVRLYEAVLYGAPQEAGELVLVTAFPDGTPVVNLTESPVQLLRPGAQPQLDPPDLAVPDPDVADRTATSMRATARPVQWGPSALVRGLAGLGAVAVAAVIKVVSDEVAGGSDGWSMLPLLSVVFVPGGLANYLNWRITADRSGLWLSGPWRVRHLPWDTLRAAVYTPNGGIVELHRTDGETWDLPSLGWPWLERKLRIRPSYVRAVEEITAMQAHPELRPTEESPVRDHGVPLGPVMVLLLACWTAAVLIV